MQIVEIVRKAFVREQRSSLILKNILASFLVKGWSVVVQLLLVPLTLACLGVYENGVWLTISSVLIWIDNLDVGLGNGLRNKLAVCIAENNIMKAQQMVSSTIAMLTVIIVPVCIALVAIDSFCDVYYLFNVSSIRVENLSIILVASTILVSSTFILKFLGNFYMGLQLPAINNAIVTGGNTLSLIGTCLAYVSGSHSLMYIAIANTAGPLLAYGVCYPITFCGKYKYLRPSIDGIKLSAMKELFFIGSKFFVLQLAGIVLFFSTNFIISQFFSPAMVTPYQIANRYFMVAMLLFTIICVPYWSATTDAYAKKDFDWIKRANRTLNKFMFYILLLIAIMIMFSSFVYQAWIGDKACVPFSMTFLVGIYEYILIMSTRYSFILNGIGKLKLQLYVTIFAAVLYIPLAIVAVKNVYDINMLLVVMCIVNLPGMVINAIQYTKVINGTAIGIWNK